MKHHFATTTRLLMSACLIALLSLPTARSQPRVDGGVAVAPNLPLGQLGATPDLAFYGVQGTESLTIPVPPGLEPLALTAITQMPVNVRSATITVMQGDRTIARVDVPPGEQAPISIPLAGAALEDNAVNVLLRTYLLPVDGYCLDPTNPLRLSDVSVNFGGQEQVPTAVADFLPPILRQLTVFVGAQPSHAVADATMRLVTAVVSRYGTQNPDISVVPLQPGQDRPPQPSAPLQRYVVIREGADTGVSLMATGGVPALLIAGPRQELANQSRLLGTDVGRLALSSKAVVGPLNNAPQLPAEQTTLRRLGQPGVNATALSPQVNIALDQTRLGRSARGIRVHLRGSYTPLPDSVGGQLVASIAGQPIDRWPADPTGAIDRWVNLPDSMLTRYTNLGLQLDIAGNTGRCGEFQPLTLIIDGDSPVMSSAAQPPVPGGFQSIPQALMPRTVVGIGDGFDDLRRAVAIMVGLQRLSALPIDTAVKSLDDAVGDNAPAVLVSSSSWTDDRITLPVKSDGDNLIVARADAPGETTTLTLNPALRFGSLQTVYSANRGVLVATSNNAPEQLDALLDWLGQDVKRWSNLVGTALISTPGHQPVVINTGSQTNADEKQVEQSAALPRWGWVAVGVVAVLLVAAAGLIALRARRIRRQS